MINLDPVPIDPTQLRTAFGCFPSGVTAICGMIGGRPAGMAANSFCAVSVSPLLVSVCVQNSSTTWPTLRDRPRLGLSVLAENQDLACRDLAARDTDRFAAIHWETTADGAVFVSGATAWLECSIDREVPAGDHTLVLLGIHRLRAHLSAAPLVFHGSEFRRLAM